MPDNTQQIKSKQRVREQGEVFTAEREVNAMLDLVKAETERIDSRFLEPACGNGNFMVKILERKLAVIYRNNTEKFEKKADISEIDLELVTAVSSIYGIDIMEDNVAECRLRLLEIIKEWYPHAVLGRTQLAGDLLATIQFILRRNVLWGDALTLCTPDEQKLPITFSEWGFVGMSVKRRDYHLSELLKPRKFDGPSLFDSLGDDVFIPQPCAEFPMIRYDKLYTQEK